MEVEVPHKQSIEHPEHRFKEVDVPHKQSIEDLEQSVKEVEIYISKPFRI